MADRRQQAWEDWGRVDPLFAVLTDFSHQHGGWDEVAFFATGAETVGRVLDEAAALGRPGGHRRALDFGCGVGRLSRALAGPFDEVVGLDVADSMVEEARRLNRAVPGCTFEVHRDRDLARFPDGHFDLVLCLLVLQHTGSTAAMERYLTEFARVLAPGGVAVVQIPSKVPAPPPPPATWSRASLRRRAGSGLRHLGVPPDVLYRRGWWSPEMTMTGLDHDRVVAVLEGAGAPVLGVIGPEVDAGGTENRTYLAGPPA
jgi:SAM-dependent methyltransferase